MPPIKSINRHLLIFAKFFVAALIAGGAAPLNAQVPGCKDPAAINYNANATLNDGSCQYNPTFYTPPVKVNPMNAVLTESSGLQMGGGFLWSFNDGGGAAAIYRIDTLSSNKLQTVNLGGASNVDWEDIAFDGVNFYVGDFGNNKSGSRSDLKIYKFALGAIPDYPANPVVTIPASEIEIISFIYSDQGTPDSTAQNKTKFDCEAMIVDNGQIHLFTKNWIDTLTTHYIVNSLAAGSYVATPVDTLETKYLVTGADKAPGQNIVALLGYQTAFPLKHFMYLLSDYDNGKYFNGNKRLINLPDGSYMGQAEGISFRNNTYGYISNEQILAISQKLHSFDISDLVPLYVLPTGLENFKVDIINGSNKISWSFGDVVQNLHLEYSSNGVDFSVLKTYKNSVKEIFYNKALNPVNYYRVSWQANNGATQYSGIIKVKNDVQQGLSKFVLKDNGELSFLYSGNATAAYSFRLMNSDGRVLSQTKEQAFSPGFNRVLLSKKTIGSSFVYLMVKSDRQEKATFLRVEK